MRVRTILLALAVSVLPLLYTACTACYTKPQNPEQVREKTAEATAQLKDNAKAVAEGYATVSPGRAPTSRWT